MNIADVMLNKWVDELRQLNKTLQYANAGTPEWYRQLEERQAKLEERIFRGYARCYPDQSEEWRRRQLNLATT